MEVAFSLIAYLLPGTGDFLKLDHKSRHTSSDFQTANSESELQNKIVRKPQRSVKYITALENSHFSLSVDQKTAPTHGPRPLFLSMVSKSAASFISGASLNLSEICQNL